MSDAQVQQVKQKADIVQVVGERVTLKKAGRHFSGLCPFHGEKTPSFTVSPEMQIYKCFGCGEGGDVFSFLQAYEGMTFAEALEFLAKQVGVELTSGYRTSADGKRETLLAILAMAAEYYAYILKEHAVGDAARTYLKDRWVGKDAIHDFSIGYAPDSWTGLTDYLTKKKGFDLDDVVATGMAIRKQRVYDRFRGRVVFPLKTYAGQIVGFSGRVLNPDEKQAKYINTPETTLYKKRELLFGMHLAKRSIRQHDRVVVVEGEMDVISSHQVHVKEVVAVKGSALTEQHILLMRRLTRNVILALDADSSGQEAISRAIPLAEQHGMNLKVLQLPEGKDPDELIKKDAQLWKDAITNAVSVYQFYIDLAVKTHDLESGTGMKQVSQFLAPILAGIENAVERAFYVKKLAETLEVAEPLVEQELAKARLELSSKARKEERGDEKGISTKRMSRRERLEHYVIGMALHGERHMQVMLQQLEPAWFSAIQLARLLERLKALLTEHVTLAQLVQQLDASQQAQVQSLYALDMELMQYDLTELRRLFERAVDDLSAMATHDELKAVAKQMSTYDGDDEGRRALEQRYRTLRDQVGTS